MKSGAIFRSRGALDTISPFILPKTINIQSTLPATGPCLFLLNITDTRTMDRPPFPDISKLNIHDPGPQTDDVLIPDDIKNASSDDPATDRLKTYVKSLPYSVESNSRMQYMLDFILMRLVQCVKAKDYDPGFLQWDSMIT